MKIHKNLESLLDDYSKQLSSNSLNRTKITTDLFIKGYIKNNSFNIDANNELLTDLKKIRLKDKDVNVYTFSQMEKDKRLILKIIDMVKNNNYSFIVLQKFRKRL